MVQYKSANAISCVICGSNFPHNKSGKFTLHLNNEHAINLNDYLIKYYYDKDDLICNVCGKSFIIRRGKLSSFCSRCDNEKRKVKGVNTCKICGKDIPFVGCARKHVELCSLECKRKNMSIKIKKYQDSLSSDEKKEIKSKMVATKTQTDKLGRGRIPWNKGKTGVYSKETIDKIRAATIAQIKSGRFYRSSIELKFENILKDMNIAYKTTYVIENRQYDFILPDYKILVECDGDYWHKNASIAKFMGEASCIQNNNIKNDVHKNIIAFRHNMLLIRFWESEILNAPHDIVTKLSTYISILKDNQQPS